MERQNFFVNGGIKMPIGYRFLPTDEELVVHYLKRKALSLPLPASVIPEFDVFQTDPWSLPGDLKENRYFFSNRHDNDSNNKCKIVAGCGYWKPTGKDKPILASGSTQVVGMRKALIFCERKRSNGTKTRWLLHQYRLVGSVLPLDSTQMFKRELFGDWSVFRVFQRKRKVQKHGVISNQSQTTSVVTKPTCIDFKVEDCSVSGPPQPTSPSSSLDNGTSHGMTGIRFFLSANGAKQDPFVGHSAPLVSRNQELSTSYISSLASSGASPISTPPLIVPRSFSIPTSNQRAMAIHVSRLLEAPQVAGKDGEAVSPPLTPISAVNIKQIPGASEVGSYSGQIEGDWSFV